MLGLARLNEKRLASSLSGSGSLILVSSASTRAVARLGSSLSAVRSVFIGSDLVALGELASKFSVAL